MADSFDPYHVWLGIPREHRPPTHYQLLAISPDEQDRAVINAAVTRQSAYVRNFQVGKHGADAARILGEIQAAKLCLLDTAKRAAYDARLPIQQARPAAVPAPQAAAFPFDLDALGGPTPSAPQTQPRRATPRLQTFSKQKTSRPWQLPVVGLTLAVLVAVVIGFAVSRRDEPPTIKNQSVEQVRSQENERDAAPLPTSGDSENEIASGDRRAGKTGPQNTAKSAAPTEFPQNQPPPGPLSLVADASHPLTTPGVVAESIVLHNSHNGDHRDRGTRQCNLSLWRDGREVWRKDAVDMDWSPDDEKKTTVPVPTSLRFDRVRVEVVKWENHGGALAEIEVLHNRRNLALGCPAVGFTTFGPQYTPARLTDGDMTSYHEGAWLLPDNSRGWAEVDLAFASPRPSPGVLADELVIWNTHNAHHNDRGALELNVRLSLGDEDVWRRDGVEIAWRGGADPQVTLALPEKHFDRVRIEIPRWTDLGAGLTEVQVRRAGVNLARACPTIASGRLYGAADPAKAVDGVTSSAVDFTGYWLAPDRTPAWIEIDLSCNCPDLGRAHRELGQYRALVEKDWPRGLPWLARSENIDLRALALLDASGPSDAWQVAGVGDGWWDLAEASSGSARDDLMVRAASHYARCLRGLTGAERARLEKRIDQCLPRPEGTPLYLLRETEVSGVYPGDNLRRQVIWRGERAAWGLSTHPNANESARAVFTLAKKHKRLTGAAAIADASGGLAATPLTFKIVGDGRTLWTSPPLQKLSAGEPFDVSIAGIDRLELVVDCPGSCEHCHAVWIDPMLDAAGETKLAKATSSGGRSPPPNTKAGQTPPREGDTFKGKGNTIDLLSLIDLDRDLLSGEWKFDGRGLASTANTVAQCELPVKAPDEYVLTAVVEGRPHARELLFGLLISGHPAWLRIDGYAGTITNLMGLDGNDVDHNPTVVRGRMLRDDGPNTIVCTVRRGGVRLECNGRTEIDWHGDPARIKTDDFPARLANDLILQSWNNACRVTKLELAATSPADWRPQMSVPAKTAKKLAKPEGSKLRVAKRTVDSTYNKPLRLAKSATDRWNVIERMREQGAQTYDDIALQYALFDESRERAVAMGQVATACYAIEDLGRVFNIHVVAAKEEAVLTGLLKTSTPKQLATGAMVALLVADRAMTAGDLDRAEKLLTAADAASRKLGLAALSEGVAKRRSTFKILGGLAVKQRADEERLRNNPDDAEASGAVGLYRLLVLGDLKKGLSLLAKGNRELAEIARLEQTAEGQPADRLPLAKAWKAAVEEGSPWRKACLAQAKYWVRRASATSAGKSDPALAALAAELRPVAVLNAARLKPGLRAVLFNGADFQYPRVRRTDTTIGLNCGWEPPAPGVSADSFSIRWSGWLLPPVAGKYVIKTTADDSIRLRIDDKLLIDRWGTSGVFDDAVEVDLTDAPHRLIVECNDYGNPALLWLRWSLKDSSTEHLLPADALFHDAALE